MRIHIVYTHTMYTLLCDRQRTTDNRVLGLTKDAHMTLERRQLAKLSLGNTHTTNAELNLSTLTTIVNTLIHNAYIAHNGFVARLRDYLRRAELDWFDLSGII